jgi:hypothetical protein
LLQLGIKHYIRKIKQPTFNPENFTHVYVIVPVNQSTGSLNNGYYTIDGTLKSTQEPIYIETKDFFMDKLQHYGLQKPAGLNGDIDFSGIVSNTISSLNLSSLSSLFNGIDCIGGSAYDKKYLNNNISLINSIFAEYVKEINLAVVNDISKLGYHVANFKGFAKLLDAAFKKSKAQGWNSCSTANFNATIKVTEYFATTATASLDAWLSKYFRKETLKSTVVFKNYKSLTVGFEDGDGFWGTSAGGVETVVISEPEYGYSINSNDEDIKQFVLNTYTLESHKEKAFNANEFLQTLSTVLVSFSGNNNTVGVDESGQNVYNQQNPPKTTSNAGMGYLFGLLAFGGLAVWGFNKLKDNGKSKKSNDKI